MQPSNTEARTDKILPSPHRLHSDFTNSLNSVLFFPFVDGKFGLGVLEVEENNRMGNIRDLFKKIGEIKETFHVTMGMIKDRNGKDLTEEEEIKKRWQEYRRTIQKRS